MKFEGATTHTAITLCSTDNKILTVKNKVIAGVAFFSKNAPKETQAVIQNNIKNYHIGVSGPGSESLFLHELYWSPACHFIEKIIPNIMMKRL